MSYFSRILTHSIPSDDYLDKVLKIKRKRFTELLEGVEKRDAAEQEEMAFQARIDKIGGDLNPHDKNFVNTTSEDSGEGALELRRLKEGLQDPELAMIDALVLSEVATRSSKDITALAR